MGAGRTTLFSPPALRFATTRITDYSMRAPAGSPGHGLRALRCALRWLEVATTREAAARLVALEHRQSASAFARAPPRQELPGQLGFGF